LSWYENEKGCIVTKPELIERMAAKSVYLTYTDTLLAVNTLLEEMAKTLEKNERIEIRGFGSFSLRHFSPRQARNPKTGETVQVGSRSAIHFKAGLEMRERIKNSRQRIILI